MDVTPTDLLVLYENLARDQKEEMVGNMIAKYRDKLKNATLWKEIVNYCQEKVVEPLVEKYKTENREFFQATDMLKDEREKNRRLESAVTEKSAEIKGLNVKLAQTSVDLNGEKQKNQQLLVLVAANHEQIEGLKWTSAKKDEEIKGLKEAITKEQEKVVSSERALDRRKRRYSATEKNLQEAKDQLAKKTDELASRNDELAKVSAALKELQLKVVEQAKQLDSQTKQISENEVEIRKLRNPRPTKTVPKKKKLKPTVDIGSSSIGSSIIDTYIAPSKNNRIDIPTNAVAACVEKYRQIEAENTGLWGHWPSIAKYLSPKPNMRCPFYMAMYKKLKNENLSTAEGKLLDRYYNEQCVSANIIDMAIYLQSIINLLWRSSDCTVVYNNDREFVLFNLSTVLSPLRRLSQDLRKLIDKKMEKIFKKLCSNSDHLETTKSMFFFYKYERRNYPIIEYYLLNEGTTSAQFVDFLNNSVLRV